MAAKDYQFAALGINGSVGRGNTVPAMQTTLTQIGMLQYPNTYYPLKYHYTPLESGEYSFYFSLASDGGHSVLLDDFKLEEGYISIISDANTEFDFENGIPYEIILEGTETSTIALTEEEENNYIEMLGSTDEGAWDTGNNIFDRRRSITEVSNSKKNNRTNNNNGGFDIWEYNQRNITKVNMKVNAQNTSNVMLTFDFKQKYEVLTQESAFRVVANGILIEDILYAQSTEAGEFITHQYDLSEFAGSDIKISLQHLGKTIQDVAYLDNIKFTSSLSVSDYNLSSINASPNPVKDIITISSPGMTITKTEVYNVNGQQLFVSNSLNENMVKLNLNSFSSGIYFIKVYCGTEQKTFKVVKN